MDRRHACLLCIALGQGCSSNDENETQGVGSANSTSSTSNASAGASGGSSSTSDTASTANSDASSADGASSTSGGGTSTTSTTGASGGGGEAATDGQSGVGGTAGGSGASPTNDSSGGSGGGSGGFRDSFEDGKPSPWALGPEGGDAAVTDETAADGTYSLRVPGDVFYYAGPNITFEPIPATHVGWWIRFSGAAPGNNGLAHFALSADDAAQDQLVQIWAASDGFLFDAGFAQPIGGDTPQQDTWYHLEMSIDWDTRIATLSVDGSEILESELDGAGEAIARIDLFTVEDATCYFDEIEVLP